MSSSKMARWTPSPSSSPREIDLWLQYISTRGRLINGLADTIFDWGEADLRKLRLMERGLSEDDIVKLLTAKPLGCNGDIVIHSMALFDHAPTIISLLEEVKSKANFLSIVSSEDGIGLNVFGYACWWNRPDLYRYLAERVGKNDAYKFLCKQGKFGWTGLHWAIGYDNPVNELLSLLENMSQANRLLCTKDGEGRTAFSCSIYWAKEKSFQSIIKFYMDEREDRLLLKMASITDHEDNTSFHHAAGQDTPNFLTFLVRSMCTLKLRRPLTDILSLKNAIGHQKCVGYSVVRCHPDNELIYEWAYDSLTKNHYLLFDLPSVLVVYTTANRPRAEDEAESIITSFTALGLEVKCVPEFTEEQLIQDIKDSQEGLGKNGQIVVLMSHGYLGHIKDSAGVPIPLNTIAEEMFTPEATPKVIILQCCQRDSRRGDQAFYPDENHYILFSSCSPLKTARQNLAIPALADGLANLKLDQDINVSMTAAKSAVAQSDKPYQKPFVHDQLLHSFCIKNILPLCLASKRNKST